MYKIAIASGKGGTGKTSVAVNLVNRYQKPIQYVDVDVEEPNGHIYLKPHWQTKKSALVDVPEIDDHWCTLCGKCKDACQFNALAIIPNKGVMVFPELCHGCGACLLACPQKAISDTSRLIGKVCLGVSDIKSEIRLIQGVLNEGEAKSPPLIKATKKEISDDTIAIIDAPPGTSCPVVDSVKGADLVVLVTEPTPMGLNDLKLAAAMSIKMGLPIAAIINKTDITDFPNTEQYLKERGIPILMKLPFDRKLAEASAAGELITSNSHFIKDYFDYCWENLLNLLEQKREVSGHETISHS